MAQLDSAQQQCSPAPRGVISSVALGWLLIVTSLLGVVASLKLTTERMAQLANPDHVASCDLNPILSCSSVMNQPEAAIFGFSNSLLGLVSFGAILAAGGALIAGGRFKPFFWWLLIAGELAGVVMVHYLMAVSILVLHTICPWCVVTWFATIPAFVYTVIYAAASGQLGVSERVQQRVAAIGVYHPVIVGGWLVAITCAVVVEYIMLTS